MTYDLHSAESLVSVQLCSFYTLPCVLNTVCTNLKVRYMFISIVLLFTVPFRLVSELSLNSLIAVGQSACGIKGRYIAI